MKDDFLKARLLIICAAMVFLGLAACSSRSPQISIAGQEARLSPVLLGVCSVFMKIENTGDGGDSLIGVSIDIPDVIAEIHDVRDGKMVKQERLHIPAKSVLVLRPMANHVMAYKMPKDIKEGSEFNLRLRFEKSGEKTTRVRIVK